MKDSAYAGVSWRWLRIDAWDLLVFVSACVLVVALYWDSPAVRNQYDDAYITYRFAIRLAEGDGLVFNVGERIDSASSFLYAVVLGLAYRVGLRDLELVGAILGVASAGGTGVVVHNGARQLGAGPWGALLLALACVGHGFISSWAVSGMDTALFCLLVAWFVRRELLGTRGKPWWSAALLGLVVLARPEGILLLLTWAGCLAADGRANGASWRGPTMKPLMAVLAVASVYYVTKFAYYGTWVPHALQLKRVWSAYQANPEKLLGSWSEAGIAPALLALGGIYRLPRGPARLALSAYLVVSVVALALGPSGGGARYSVHLLPILFMLSVPALVHLARELPPLGLGLALLGLWQTYASERFANDQARRRAEHQICRKEIGRALAAMRPDAPVLSSDVGAIAYAAPSVPFVDVVGLTSIDVLQSYLSGAGLAPVLAGKRPGLVADTLVKEGKPARLGYRALQILASPGTFLDGDAQPSGGPLRVVEAKRLHTCTAGDGTQFALGTVTQLGAAEEPPAE